ncbi:MAG: S1C family serine protease [Oscillospiraceae bacterium]
MNLLENDPREVTLCYGGAQEVVEIYRQETPLPEPPGRPKAETAPQHRRRRKRGLIIFLALMALLAVVVAVSWSLAPRQESSSHGAEIAEESGEPCTIPLYEGDETAEMTLAAPEGPTLSAQEIYQRVNPAVVTVIGQLEGKQSVGTGVIFSENGFILTNAHVIEGCSACFVVLAEGGYPFEATLVGYDSGEDLAVLKIEGDGVSFPTVCFGDSDALWVGEPVYAIGNPLGVDLRGTFTSGMVSGLSREISVDGVTLCLLQTDAALNNGNSGGPLINERGQVIGINTAKMQSAYSNVEGIGFAIPTADAQKKVNDLIRYGEVQPSPVVGITVAPLAEWTADGHGGLEVWEVTPGGGGDLAGIQVGDVVIRADGQQLMENDDLIAIRDTHQVGDTLTLDICRGGEHFTAEVVLQEG